MQNIQIPLLFFNHNHVAHTESFNAVIIHALSKAPQISTPHADSIRNIVSAALRSIRDNALLQMVYIHSDFIVG